MGSLAIPGTHSGQGTMKFYAIKHQDGRYLHVSFEDHPYEGKCRTYGPIDCAMEFDTMEQAALVCEDGDTVVRLKRYEVTVEI